MVWNRFVTIFWNKSMGKAVVCNLARAKLEKILGFAVDKIMPACCGILRKRNAVEEIAGGMMANGLVTPNAIRGS